MRLADDDPSASGAGDSRPGRKPLRWSARSLRSQLYIWLLAPLLVLSLVNSFLNYASAIGMAQALIDQRLAGSARLIGESVVADENGLRVEIPPAALENLQTSSRDRIYYRVDTAAGRLLTGTPDLPVFHGALASEGWQGYDAHIQGEAVRAVVFAQPVHSEVGTTPVLIQIATTTQAHTLLTRRIWLRAVWPQALLLIAVAALGRLWTRAAMVPLLRIGAAVRHHPPDSAEPIEAVDAPTELRPLVRAINDYIDRIAHHVAERDRFISNAAHQLKTPITVLNTQVTVGLRSQEPAQKHDALEASYATLQHCIRLLRQLLTLSAADHRVGERLEASPTDLTGVVHDVLVDLAELADAKDVDLGIVSQEDGVFVLGAPVLLRAMLENLVDNAIRYGSAGTTVTVSVHHQGRKVAMVVEDNGPGIPPHEREHVFERFYRCDRIQEEGSGLGLAIVREIALALKAKVELQDRQDGKQGLRVVVSFEGVEPPEAEAQASTAFDRR